MKKTYVKITSLICVLITAVMLLGCALFTYVEITMVNKDCLAEIHNNTQILPGEYNAQNEDINSYVMNQRGRMFIAGSGNPNIGYYGKCTWRVKGEELVNTVDSTRFTRIIAYFHTSEDGTHFSIVVPEDGKADGKVYFDPSVSGNSVDGVVYSTDDSSTFTIISSKKLAVVKDSSSITASYEF